MFKQITLLIILFFCSASKIAMAQLAFEGMVIMAVPTKVEAADESYNAEAIIQGMNAPCCDVWPPDIPAFEEFEYIDLTASVIYSAPDDIGGLSWDKWPPDIPNEKLSSIDPRDTPVIINTLPEYGVLSLPEGSKNNYFAAIIDITSNSSPDSNAKLTVPALKFEWPAGGHQYIGIKLPSAIDLKSVSSMSIKAIEPISASLEWPPEMKEITIMNPENVYQALKAERAYFATE